MLKKASPSPFLAETSFGFSCNDSESNSRLSCFFCACAAPRSVTIAGSLGFVHNAIPNLRMMRSWLLCSSACRAESTEITKPLVCVTTGKPPIKFSPHRRLGCQVWAEKSLNHKAGDQPANMGATVHATLH